MTLAEQLKAKLEEAQQEGDVARAGKLKSLMERADAAVITEARGQGLGMGGGRQGDGGTDVCVCPDCGTEQEHERGVPCTEIRCPECAAVMVGKVDEAYVTISGSYEATIGELRQAVRSNLDLFGGKPEEEWSVGIEATFPGKVIVTGPNEAMYQAAWSRNDVGEIELTDVQPVTVTIKAGGEVIPVKNPAADTVATLGGSSDMPAMARETHELLEVITAPLQVLSETTTEKGDHLMTVACRLTPVNTPTRNGRVYTESLAQKLVAECAQGTDRAKRWLGEVSHPESGYPRLHETVCTPWRNIRIDEGWVIGETDIIDTQRGSDLQKLIRNGVPVQVSSRTIARTTTEVREGKSVEIVDEATALANWGGWDYVLGAAAEGAGVMTFTEAAGEPAATSTPEMDVPGDSIDEVLNTMNAEELKKMIQEQVDAGMSTALKPLLETKDPAAKQDEPVVTAEQKADPVSDLAAQLETLTATVNGFVAKLETDKKDAALQEALSLGRKAVMETSEVQAWPEPARKLLEKELKAVVDVEGLATKFESTQRQLTEVGLLVMRAPSGAGLTTVHAGSSDKGRADMAKEFQLGVLAERFLPESVEEAMSLLSEGIPDNGMRSSGQADDPIRTYLGGSLPFPGYHPGNPRHVFEAAVRNTIAAYPSIMRAHLRGSRLGMNNVFEWTAVANVAQSVPYILPLIRQVWPRLIATELCSVQPMNRSTGLVHYLDFVYDPGGGNPATPGEFVSEYGNNVSEQAAVPEMKLTLTSADITMDTKKLKAEWSSEVAQNLRADFGMDIAAEMMNAMADEIAREVNALLINDMLNTADPNGFTTAGNVNFGCLLPAAGYVNLGEWQKELYRHILQADALVRALRRSRTNWVVAGSNALVRLMRLENWSMTADDETGRDWSVGINRVGTLDGNPKIKVYSCDADFFDTETLLLGRKGTEWPDAGMVYCPFIPIYTSGKFVDPNTFCEREAVMSRFGYRKVVGNSFATVTCLPAAQGVAW